MSNFYTPLQLSKLTNLHYRTVLREIKRGNIKFSKFGKQFLISQADLDTYLHSKREEAIRPLEISVAIVERVNQILLVQRRVKEGNLQWQFPGGGIKFGENSAARAEIECLEETGVHCRAKIYFGNRVHPDTKVIIHYWLCEYMSGAAVNLDADENSTVEWVEKQNVPSRLTSNVYPPIKDFLLN